MQRSRVLQLAIGARRFSNCGARLVLVAWVTLLSLAAAQQSTPPAPGPVTTLELGKAIEHEISGDASDKYLLTLEAHQAASITVEQRGVDVTISVDDPTGETLADFDSESRIPGEEHVILNSGTAATFHLKVKARYSRAAAGIYQIRVTDIRPSSDKDRLLFEAHELIHQARGPKSKLDDARSLAERAVNSAQEALGENDPYVGELLVNLAEFERNKDNLAKSEQLFQRAISIDKASLGEEHPQTAFAELRLGALYNSTGEYTKAEALFQQSVSVIERTLGSSHPAMIPWLMNLSNVYSYREDFAQALPELERARAIAEQSLPPDDFSFISIINNLGDLYVHSGRYEQAKPLVEQTIEMVERTRGPDYPRLVEPLMTLAIIEREEKQYARAFELLDRAKAISEKNYGPRHTETATVLIVVGNVQRAAGDFAKALDTYQQARDIFETAAGPYHRWTQLTYVNAAIAYAALGDTDRAIAAQARSDELLERSIALNLSIGSEREKLAFLEAASDRTDRTISTNALLAPDNAAATNLAAQVLLQRKGRVLDAMSGSLAVLRQRMSPDDQKLLDDLNTTTAKLAKLALHGAGKTPPDEYHSQMAALEKQRDDLEAAISRRSAEFRTLAQSITVSAVESAIPPQAALLEFASYRPFDPKAESNTHAYGDAHYIAYVLRANGDVRWKELGPAKAVDDAVSAFRASLRDPDRIDVQSLARALDGKIMQPLRPFLADAKQLLISPDGDLNLIPFEALLDENRRYLVERYSISYLTTGRDLLRLQVARSSHGGPVVVADPVFGDHATAEVAAKRARTSPAAARRSVTTATDLSSVYFSPLAGTAAEAGAIKAQFPDAQLLTGAKATQAALKQVDAPSILHIATHGFFLADPDHPRPADARGATVPLKEEVSNPLLRSGLALAGANRSHTGTDTGILTALEASNLNLWGTKLVTLSACDTGVGEIRNGEGVYGLRRAFFLAGAESVVMSLWPVSDYATREVMTSYYKGLKKGLGRGEALRQTKLALLKRKDRRHPFYWASFIQAGEWANLNGQR